MPARYFFDPPDFFDPPGDARPAPDSAPPGLRRADPLRPIKPAKRPDPQDPAAPRASPLAGPPDPTLSPRPVGGEGGVSAVDLDPILAHLRIAREIALLDPVRPAARRIPAAPGPGATPHPEN